VLICRLRSAASSSRKLGRQEQDGQQLRSRIWQQLRRQEAPGRPLGRGRTQQLRHPPYERLLPRCHTAVRRRAVTKGAHTLACAEHEVRCRRLPGQTSAAHQERSAQGGARRVRGREQLGQRCEQRLCSRRDGLRGARRQKYRGRVRHGLHALAVSQTQGCCTVSATLALLPGTGSKPPCQPQGPNQSRHRSSWTELSSSRLHHSIIGIALRWDAYIIRPQWNASSCNAQSVRQAPHCGLHGRQRERQQALAPLGIPTRRLSFELHRSRQRCSTAEICRP